MLSRRKRARRRDYSGLNRYLPGRTRERLAALLKAKLNIDVDPSDILQNNTPWSKQMDLCRWCCDGKRDGNFVHVASWDRMGDILKHGLAVVFDKGNELEVCRGD